MPRQLQSLDRCWPEQTKGASHQPPKTDIRVATTNPNDQPSQNTTLLPEKKNQQAYHWWGIAIAAKVSFNTVSYKKGPLLSNFD